MAKGESQAGLETGNSVDPREGLINDSSVSKQLKGLELKSPITFPEMKHELFL